MSDSRTYWKNKCRTLFRLTTSKCQILVLRWFPAQRVSSSQNVSMSWHHYATETAACPNDWLSWWRHQMEAFSTLLALCAGNSPSQRPVTRSFEFFFDLRLNKSLSKQSWGWWFGTPSRSLWRHSISVVSSQVSLDYSAFTPQTLTTLPTHWRYCSRALSHRCILCGTKMQHGDVITWTVQIPHCCFFYGETLVADGFPLHKRPAVQSFGGFFIVRLDKLLNKQLIDRWSGTT